MPSLSAKLSRESCIRPSNSSRSRESWITRPEAPMGTGGWADRGLWEACGFAEARFKAVPPSSSREKPRPVERPDGRSRPLHFSTKIGTPLCVMELDASKVDDAVLALLYLGLHEGTRAWKGFDWDAMVRLHRAGLISDPRGKAKSV